MSNGGGAAHPRGATVAGQCSCTSLISRAFPHLWPRGAEISFCLTIDHCRTILYYIVLLLDLAPRRRYCRLSTLTIKARQPHRVADPDSLDKSSSRVSAVAIAEARCR